MTITLHGDTFAADVVSRLTAANVPSGLSAAFTRVSDTQVQAELTGEATAHDSANTIHNLTFTFTAGAFATVPAGEVEHYQQTLSVLFNDVEVFNSVPYEEPFEGYASGTWLAETNESWKALINPDGGVIAGDAPVIANLLQYSDGIRTFPIVTNHTKVLSVQESMRVAVHSGTEPKVYLDFMAQPGVLREAPPCDTNLQYAFYVNTNLQLAIWHCNRTRTPVSNEWMTLQQSPLIDTSRWMRITVAQDYSNHMFQVILDQGSPIIDPSGWQAGGVAPTGSWFHMVQTNAGMSHLTISGVGKAYVDDLTVRLTLPASFGVSQGTVFRFR